MRKNGKAYFQIGKANKTQPRGKVILGLQTWGQECTVPVLASEQNSSEGQQDLTC